MSSGEERELASGMRGHSGWGRDEAGLAVAGADISGDGLLLLPGFIDMHGDMVEREVEPRPNVPMPMAGWSTPSCCMAPGPIP